MRFKMRVAYRGDILNSTDVERSKWCASDNEAVRSGHFLSSEMADNIYI